MSVGHSRLAPGLEQPFIFSPPGAPPEPVVEPAEGAELHFKRLRLFRDIPLGLRQYSREQCWEIVCNAVVDVPAEGGGR